MSKELIERLRDISGWPETPDFVAEAADTIEKQQSWIASLEQNARDADRMYKELETELAASQAQIKVLREAIERYLPESDHCSDNGVQFYRELSDVLDKPTDDSALRELLKAERERCAKVVETAEVPIDIDIWCGTKKALTAATAIGLATKIRAMEDK